MVDIRGDSSYYYAYAYKYYRKYYGRQETAWPTSRCWNGRGG